MSWKLVRHPRGGWEVKGYADLEKLEKIVKEKNLMIVFGYYGDIELEWVDGKFRTLNTATGAVLYEGENFKEAFFRGKAAGRRYNELDDKFFHSEFEQAALRGFAKKRR